MTADPPRQRGLFGPIDEPPQRGAAQVHPVTCDAELRALAARLPRTLRLGTSSWNFPGWRGLVFANDAPAKHLSRLGLGAYAAHPLLRTVGVDRTFYAPIAAGDFADYAAQVPDDFRFLVKAWETLLTPRLRGERRPNPRYLDVEAFANEVVAPAVDGLGKKLGTLLLQLPPQGPQVVREPGLFADCLFAFLSHLPAGVPYAVELRDAALCTARYAEAVRAAGARHCLSVHPQMPPITEQRQIVGDADGALVVRWMLHAGLAYEQAKQRYEPFGALVDPDPDTRADVAALCREALLRDVEVTVVVNNKAEGSAPLSVLELARAIVAATAR